MCGICGQFEISQQNYLDESVMKSMTATLSHRGPDASGLYLDDSVILGHTRLSIIDLTSGGQPMTNEDGTLWITFNGEIFNYVEIKEKLLRQGHTFRTTSDTEVILHLFEEKGEKVVEELNGQFAFAIWDTKKQRLFLARDRVGIRPLYYWHKNNSFVFASEIKALFADPRINRELDLKALAQIFTFWAPLPGETPFQDVKELPAGHYMWVNESGVRIKPYWDFHFDFRPDEIITDAEKATIELKNLLKDAVRLRLRADVPVGTYLSGGLDSSTITGLVRHIHQNELRTFSIRFSDRNYDESIYQQELCQYLNTNHSYIAVNPSQVGKALSDVIYHTEKPILRTAPIPLFLLSQLVRDSGYKVVLTGEGADEILTGYNIFKEVKIRRFWARYPDSKWRPKLFSRIYNYVDARDARGDGFWQAFFNKDLLSTDDPFYSHNIRWSNTQFILSFLSNDVKNVLNDYDPITDLRERINGRLDGMHSQNKAQFLEAYIFLSNYLLSSQGDRMLMAHSVEGRFPFLDHRVIEFANRLSPSLKLRVLDEKWVLKNAFKKELPESIVSRKKQPYRAPIRTVLKAVNEHLSPVLLSQNLKKDDVFNNSKVDILFKRLNDSSRQFTAREEMAAMGVITTQLLTEHFIHNTPKIKNKIKEENRIICDHRKRKNMGVEQC